MGPGPAPQFPCWAVSAPGPREIRGEHGAGPGEDLEPGPRGPPPEGLSGYPSLGHSPWTPVSTRTPEAVLRHRQLAPTPPPISTILGPGWDSGRTSQQTAACPGTALREGLLHTLCPLRHLLGGCPESCHPRVPGGLRPHQAAAQVVNCAPGWLLETRPQTPAPGAPRPRLLVPPVPS